MVGICNRLLDFEQMDGWVTELVLAFQAAFLTHTS